MKTSTATPLTLTIEFLNHLLPWASFIFFVRSASVTGTKEFICDHGQGQIHFNEIEHHEGIYTLKSLVVTDDGSYYMDGLCQNVLFQIDKRFYKLDEVTGMKSECILGVLIQYEDGTSIYIRKQ
jgi:hypothetical protein